MALTSEQDQGCWGSQGSRPAWGSEETQSGTQAPRPAGLALHTSHTHPTPLCHEAEDVRRDPSGGRRQGVQVRLDVQCPPEAQPARCHGNARMWESRAEVGQKVAGLGEGDGLHSAPGPGARGQGFRTSLEGTTKLLCFKFKSSQIPNN